MDPRYFDPPMPNRFPIHDTTALDQLRKGLRLDPNLVRRFRNTFCKQFRGEQAALTELPAEVSEEFASKIDFHPLELDRRCDSQIDGASKLVLRTTDGYLVEAVLLRAGTGRVSLCVSSQVGCAAACDFCATGRMGMAHNLSASQILDQFVQANQQLRSDDDGRSVRNIVFMGMGEPFHNEQVLHETLAALTDPAVFDHPPTRILVSTVGIPEAMLRLGHAFPKVNLALSLHSVRQSTREKIIPLAKRYPLTMLQETLREFSSLTGRQVMIEYLMLANLNDSLDEAVELVSWLAGINAHINLIPYNKVDEAPHLTGSTRQQSEAFSRTLKDAGLPTTIRYSMGADIEAACGQLVRQENRAVAKAASVSRVQ